MQHVTKSGLAAVAVVTALSAWIAHISAAPLPVQGTPASGSNVCRAYSTDEMRVSGRSTLHVTCKFDKSTKVHTCHITTPSYSYDQVTQFASVADFVGDPARVTFFPHAQSISVGIANSLSSQAYTYDASGHLTSITTASNAGEGGGTVQTFTAWDAFGRPTAAHDATQNYVFTYDDTQRVVVQRSSGAGGTITLKLDADGNHARSTTVTPTFSDTTTITVKATEQICK
jgi:YD repeat-containing protein